MSEADATQSALFGEMLQIARKKAGLSQDEAAERLGVSRRTISVWETTGRVEDRRVEQLRRLYGSSYDAAEAMYAGPPAAGPVTEETATQGAPEAITVVYKGYKFTLYPRAGATAEEIAQAQDAVIAAVMERLRDLGLEDVAGTG